MNNNERKAINDAYAAQIGKLYATLNAAIEAAGNDAVAVRQAAENYVAGLACARRAHTLAQESMSD